MIPDAVRIKPPPRLHDRRRPRSGMSPGRVATAVLVVARSSGEPGERLATGCRIPAQPQQRRRATAAASSPSRRAASRWRGVSCPRRGGRPDYTAPSASGVVGLDSRFQPTSVGGARGPPRGALCRISAAGGRRQSRRQLRIVEVSVDRSRQKAASAVFRRHQAGRGIVRHAVSAVFFSRPAALVVPPVVDAAST